MEDKRLFEAFWYAEEGCSHDAHHHNCYQMIFLCGGDAQVRIGGAVYRPAPKTALFISKLEEHSVRVRDGAYQRYILSLTPSQLDELVPDAALQTLFTRRMAGFCHAFPTEGQTPDVETLLREIQSELTARKPFAKSRVAALFSLVLIACIRLRPAQGACPSGESQNLMFLIRQYIDGHFAQPMTIAQLAADFYISPSHLAHSFHDCFGLSPQKYLLKSRLSYARALLLTTDEPVMRVAAKAGFGDVSNFIRSFKQTYRAPPNRYRLLSGGG